VNCDSGIWNCGGRGVGGASWADARTGAVVVNARKSSWRRCGMAVAPGV
jgi:hypothetical protein